MQLHGLSCEFLPDKVKTGTTTVVRETRARKMPDKFKEYEVKKDEPSGTCPGCKFYVLEEGVLVLVLVLFLSSLKNYF